MCIGSQDPGHGGRCAVNGLEAYLTELRLLGRSPRTIEAYKTYVTPFVEVMEEVERRSSLAEYLQNRYNRPTTRKTAFTHIKAFIRWRAGQGLGRDWVSGLKLKFAPPPVYPTLTAAEFGQVLNVIPTTLNGRRDRAMLATIFYTGMRRAAAAGLRWGDVSLKDRIVRVHTKGDKTLMLRLPACAAVELNRWRPHCPDGRWCFPSTRHPERALHPDAITHYLPRYAKAAGFERRVWVHGCRHSFATALADVGYPAEIIADALGVESIEVALIYIRRRQSRVFNAVDRAFG